MTPKEAARALIEFYVRRGDGYQNLSESWMGRSGPDYQAGIGAGGAGGLECTGKSGFITVSRIGNERVCERFSLRKIYDEIEADMSGVRRQGTLEGF